MAVAGTKSKPPASMDVGGVQRPVCVWVGGFVLGNAWLDQCVLIPGIHQSIGQSIKSIEKGRNGGVLRVVGEGSGYGTRASRKRAAPWYDVIAWAAGFSFKKSFARDLHSLDYIHSFERSYDCRRVWGLLESLHSIQKPSRSNGGDGPRPTSVADRGRRELTSFKTSNTPPVIVFCLIFFDMILLSKPHGTARHTLSTHTHTSITYRGIFV